MEKSLRPSEVLVATLGTQPAVVTVALDLLLDAGHNVQEIVVVHTSQKYKLIGDALKVLEDEFPGKTLYAFKDWPCVYRTLALRLNDQPLFDIRTREQAEVVFRAIYQEIRRQKQKGRRVHLCIAGGRKTMSVYGMATAQLLFGADDRLYHLFSTQEFDDSDALHPGRVGDAQLVPIPLLGYSHLAPPLAALLVTDDPVEAIARQQQATRLEEQRRQHEFLHRHLTESEHRIVEGLFEILLKERRSPSNRDIARRLYFGERWVGNALTAVYSKLRAFMGLSKEATVDRQLLVSLFTPYFSSQFFTEP